MGLFLGSLFCSLTYVSVLVPVQTLVHLQYQKLYLYNLPAETTDCPLENTGLPCGDPRWAEGRSLSQLCPRRGISATVSSTTARSVSQQMQSPRPQETSSWKVIFFNVNLSPQTKWSRGYVISNSTSALIRDCLKQMPRKILEMFNKKKLHYYTIFHTISSSKD